MSATTSRTAPITPTRSIPLTRIGARPASKVTLTAIATWSALGGIAAMLSFNLFTGLGTWRIADWDEARHAVNAYEMLQRGDWIGNTWRGQLDYFNLKPPLSMWAEMLSFQAFGFTPFAFRLPAVLATLLTVAVVAYFSYRVAGRGAAVVSALALATGSHFLLTHNARTGDADALFLLGTTVALVSFIASPRHPRLLLLATSAVSFAFLAKSFHVALLLVVVVPYLVITWRAGSLRLRHVAVALIGFVPVLAWAVARYAYDGTAFLGSMFLVDVLHRTAAPAEGNAAGIQYYSKLLVTSYWMWLAVLVLAVALCVLARRRSGRSFDAPALVVFIVLGVWSVAVVGVFSLMATKLAWYALAAYPSLAIMIGIAVALACRDASRVRTAAMVAAVAVATVVAQVPIMQFVTGTTADAAQSAFAALDRDPRFVGHDVYVDPQVGWNQALVAAAELGGGLKPTDGTIEAAKQDAGALVLLAEGSDAAAMFPDAAAAAVTSTDGFLLVPASALTTAETPTP